MLSTLLTSENNDCSTSEFNAPNLLAGSTVDRSSIALVAVNFCSTAAVAVKFLCHAGRG